jgi:hypothetical protein
MEHWEGQGIAFAEETVPSGALSREDALRALHDQSPGTAEKEPMAVRYGIMNAESPALGRPGEFLEPLVWGRAVWVITIPEVWIPSGPAFRKRELPVTALPMNYVLDGKTGEYVFAFGP